MSDPLYDQVQRMTGDIACLKAEVARLRHELKNVQQWKETTHAYLVEPQQKVDRDEYDRIMREGMI